MQNKVTRESIFEDIKQLKSDNILCQLPTGVGKTKMALDYLNFKQIKGNILIVVPRLVLIDNWKKEFAKWHYDELLSKTIFITYVSLPKLVGNSFEAIVYDEAHHLTERALNAVEAIETKYNVLLSATVNKAQREALKEVWPNLQIYSISMKRAIEENILPDPKVILIPMQLDDTVANQTFTVNSKGKTSLTVSYEDRFKYLKLNAKCTVKCTARQYYDNLSFWVDKYKKLYMQTNNQRYYFMWQSKAGERLKWLAAQKNNAVLRILKGLSKYRTLTFCSTIDQTKLLGEYCINSANKDSMNNLEAFNNHKIDHITACNMLNEGTNITDCQVGIFVAINSSEIMIKQKNGRILRHKKPILIIPYYVNTRENEIVDKMLLDYNPLLISKVRNLKELKNEISNR